MLLNFIFKILVATAIVTLLFSLQSNAQSPTMEIPTTKRVSLIEIENGTKPIISAGFDFVPVATDNKKLWEGSRPKNGNGAGTYKFYEGENCKSLMVGNWKDYKLDGAFHKLYNGLTVFEGIAKDGVIVSGTAYGYYYVYSRITQSHISIEERTKYKADVMGTHILPVYIGTVQKLIATGAIVNYGYLQGTVYEIKEHVTGLKPIAAVVGQWANNGATSTNTQKPSGSMHYYFEDNDNLKLKNTINYKNGVIDGLVTLYEKDGNTIEADFKNNKIDAAGRTISRNKNGIVTAIYDQNFSCLKPSGYSGLPILQYGGWTANFPENGKPYRRFKSAGMGADPVEANFFAPNLTQTNLTENQKEISWKGGRYIGESVNGVPNGWGRMYGLYSFGDYMEGNFRDGKPEGYTVLVAIGPSKRNGEIGNSPTLLELFKDGLPYKSIFGLTDAQRKLLAEENRKKIAERNRQVQATQQKIINRWYDVDQKGERTPRELPGKEGWFQHVIYPPRTIIDGTTYPATSGFYVIFRSGLDEVTKDLYLIAKTQDISFGKTENGGTYQNYPILWAASMIVNAYFATSDRIGELHTYAGKDLTLGLKENSKKDVRLIVFDKGKGKSVILQLPYGQKSFKNNTSVSMKMIHTNKVIDQDFLRQPEVSAFFGLY